MKRSSKILCLSGLTLILSAGMVFNYLQAQTEASLSDLTLANLEAMAWIEDGENIGGDARWWVTPIDDHGSKRCDEGGSEFCTF